MYISHQSRAMYKNHHCNWYIVLLVEFLPFLPARRYASAGNSDRNVSVRPSVRLSRAGIVSNRRKLAS